MMTDRNEAARRLQGADWLGDPALKAVFAAIGREGDSIRVVGGAVRNAVMGLPVADVDLATTALPEIVMLRARRAGLKPVPTGIEHGTVTVVSSGRPFEVTTLRADIATDGRHATVRFGTDWAMDAGRRDFTMNALYAEPDGTIVDPLGGLSDAASRRVRFIGDPAVRIAEDHLRILRFFRLHAAYGCGAPDHEALAACIRARASLDALSRERIGNEMRRLVIAPRAAEVAGLTQECGILGRVLAGVGRPVLLGRLQGLMAEWGATPSPALGLAALGAFVEDDAERLAGRLRLSTSERDLIVQSVRLARRIGRLSSAAEMREIVYRFGNRAALGGLVLAAAADPEADRRRWEALFMIARDWQAPVLPVSGKDLLALGLRPGPQVGQRLKAIETEWITGGFQASREELLAAAGSL